MNMISTGAFLNEMDASNKQPSTAEKFAAVWEKKNAKAARAGGVSLMALSLAACGSSSSTTSTSSTTTTTTTTSTNTALTTGLDIVTGGAGADTWSGSSTTLQAGDSVTGGAGDDALYIYSTAATTYAGFTTSGVETIVLSASGAAPTVNVAGVSGETTLKILGSSVDGTFTGADTISTLALESNTAGNATVTYNAATVEGTADSMGITTNATVNGTVTLAGIETVTVTNTGTSSIAALTTTSATTLNVAGSGTLTLTNIDDATTTVSTSGFTGTSTIDGFGAVDVTYTGGAGADTIKFTGLNDDDSIDGGAGADTLVLTAATNAFATSTVAGDITVSNVETLELVSDGNGDAIDFDIFSAPAFETVRVTITADTDDVALNDTVSSNFELRNTNNTTVANLVDFLTIDLKDSSGTADAINLTLTNRDVDEVMTISTITAAGVETLTLTADATTLTGVAGDIGVTALTMTALETVTILGDADLTLPAFSTTVETVDASGATGDQSLTFAGADVTVTGGAGADTLAFGTSLTEDDTIDGGAGTDTVTVGAVNASASNIDLNITNVERLTFTEAEASEGNATFDFNGKSIARITVTAEEDADNTLLFDDVGGTSTDLYIIGSGEADGDTIKVDLATDGTADQIDVVLTVDDGEAVFEGTVTLDDFETINFDVTASDAESGTTVADLDGADATSVVFTNDDTWDDGDVFTLTTNSIKTGATIDFTGYNQSIGNAAANADTAGAAEAANTTGAVADLATIMGTAGFTAVATGSYTILLGDGRTEDADVETVINLGTSNTGADTIRFVDSVDDGTDDIGVVVINNFNDAAGATAANRSVLDVSAFGIDALSDMTFTGGEADDGADLTVITSTEFAGSITLLGVVSTDLAIADFTLA